jgi:hypothetical protein
LLRQSCVLFKIPDIPGRYAEKLEEQGEDEFQGVKNVAREKLFDKGQSKRIWAELYKVVDSSDVVVQVCIFSPALCQYAYFDFPEIP